MFILIYKPKDALNCETEHHVFSTYAEAEAKLESLPVAALCECKYIKVADNTPEGWTQDDVSWINS